jgi:undecaprenyl-diphosphatase
MDLIAMGKAVVLGLVEGVTEFIPVSSTGHLIVVGDWLKVSGESAKTFEIFIQLGAILAVVWIYRREFLKIAKGAGSDRTSQQLILDLALAFLPAAVVGVLAHKWIKAHLFSPITVAGALIVGGIAILLIERAAPRPTVKRVEDIKGRTALGVGLAQVLSLFPGVSRSGATIMGGYLLGLDRPVATQFSFYLAVPVMFAATLFDLAGSWRSLSASDLPVFAVGFVVAFLSSLVVVRAFLHYVSRRNFTVFAWYRIAFGLLVLALYFGRPH